MRPFLLAGTLAIALVVLHFLRRDPAGAEEGDYTLQIGLGLISLVGLMSAQLNEVLFTLAFLNMILMVFNGLRLGGKDYLAHFNPGPLWMAPMMVPLEIMGTLAKIFALAVRLFANMVAGHVLLAVLMMLILMAGKALGTGVGLGVAIPLVFGSVAVNMLEIFVAFLQAFIFTYLTTLFIGMSVNFHHDEHGEAH